MILNNEFTSPESRFFYPTNHPVEHHESVDITGLPGTQYVPGEKHYAVFRDPEGEVRATELDRSHLLPIGAAVLGIGGQAEADNVRASGRVLSLEEVGAFDQACTFMPEETDDVKVVAQAVTLPGLNHVLDPRLDSNGAAVFPLGEPLTGFEDRGYLQDDWTRYRLLGFINRDDQLVTWPLSRYSARVIDWCVVNKLKQNALETALLVDALPINDGLGATLSVNEAANAYLKYFDNKHGTSYAVGRDSRDPHVEQLGQSLTDEGYATYLRLSELGNSFMRRRRKPPVT